MHQEIGWAGGRFGKWCIDRERTISLPSDLNWYGFALLRTDNPWLHVYRLKMYINSRSYIQIVCLTRIPSDNEKVILVYVRIVCFVCYTVANAYFPCLVRIPHIHTNSFMQCYSSKQISLLKSHKIWKHYPLSLSSYQMVKLRRDRPFLLLEISYTNVEFSV